MKMWDDHGTKFLGGLGTIKDILIGLAAIDGLLPASAIKYIAGIGVVIGVLTVKRGFTNSAAANTPAPPGP